MLCEIDFLLKKVADGFEPLTFVLEKSCAQIEVFGR